MHITRAVAARAHIGEPVTELLARSEAEPVLVALVRNATARISTHAFETLVEKSRRLESLHEPLSHRPDLPPVLATRMCEWVADALKAYIVANYPIAPERLSTAMTQAETVVKSEPAAPRTPPAESAQKLIDKLAASGQLKAGFLLRVLHQGQSDLFDLALAKMVDLPLAELRAKFYGGGPRAVALTCRGVGIDRCVFNTVFNLSRQARNIRPALTPADLQEVERVFKTHNQARRAGGIGESRPELAPFGFEITHPKVVIARLVRAIHFSRAELDRLHKAGDDDF